MSKDDKRWPSWADPLFRWLLVLVLLAAALVLLFLGWSSRQDTENAWDRTVLLLAPVACVVAVLIGWTLGRQDAGQARTALAGLESKVEEGLRRVARAVANADTGACSDAKLSAARRDVVKLADKVIAQGTQIDPAVTKCAEELRGRWQDDRCD